MSRTPQRNGGASPLATRCRATDWPDALSRAATLQGLGDLLSAGLTVVWEDELEAFQQDREALAALRKEAFGLRFDVLFLRCDLDRCRRELDACRGW